MKNRKLISWILFAVILVVASYFTYMAFQGTLEIISRYGEKALDFIMNVFGIFAFPGTVLFAYTYFFKEERKTKGFYLRHGIYQLVTGVLGFGFCIYDIFKYTNWGYGPTLCYPIDFLVVYAGCIALGIFCLIQKNKAAGQPCRENIAVSVCKVLYLFLALDRVGAVLVSVFSGPGTGLTSLLPLYLLSLLPMAGVILYVIVKTGEQGSKIQLIGSLTTLVLTLGCIGYVIGMLFGNYATPFMKIISSFYGLDRLSSKPITISLCALMTLAAGIWGMIPSRKKAEKGN